MRKSTLFSLMALFGSIAFCANRADAQSLMQDANLVYPSGLYVSMPPGSVTVSWENQEFKLVDPATDEYGDEYATVYLQLGDSEKYDVNAYLMYSFGNPDDPNDEDIWNLDIALYNVDDIWSFDGNTMTLSIPEGIVINKEGELNPAQELVFSIMPTFTSYTYTPESGETIDSDFVVKVSFEGNPIEYLQASVSAMVYDPTYKNIPLEFGKEVTIKGDDELLIDLSSLESGEYELVIPEGFVMVTADDTKYLSPDIWLEYTLENNQDSGVTAAEVENGSLSVYTTDGVKLLQTSDKKVFDTLPAGLYIIDGKKILIRK